MGSKIEEAAEAAATLDAMAATAAATYYENAVKFGVARYPKGGMQAVRKGRNWPRFMQVARMCMLHKIPVEIFVSAAFTRTLERHSLVTVGDICSYNPDNLTVGGDGPKGSPCPQDLWNLLSCKLLDMVFAIDGVKDKTELLDSSMYGFPAWFRVFAADKPQNDILVHWGDLALEELSDMPKLREFVRKKRPETYGLLESVMHAVKNG